MVSIVALFLINRRGEEKVDNGNNNSDISNDLVTDSDENALKVAVIGHIDHGKSTLTSAITKVYGDYVSVDKIDKGVEEREKGITIKIARVKYKSNERVYEHYDFPSHSDFLKATISGAVKLDGAILVVSATQGPMAQTREHLKLAMEFGISKIVVYISKCDLVDDEELVDLIEMEIRDLISQYGFDKDNTPIIRGSALNAINGDKKEENNIRDLVSAMDSWISPVDVSSNPLLLSIEDVFNVTGRGPVVTGRIERGKVNVGDSVQIVGLHDEVTTTEVIGINISNEERKSAIAGENVGIYLKDITRDSVERGQVLITPDSIKQSKKFEAEVYFSSREEGGDVRKYEHGDNFKFYFRTTDVLGKISFSDDGFIFNSGESTSLTVDLEQPMEVGTNFSIRNSNSRTIGIGMVTKVY